MCIFFFKQKTAYEMRISDWSSDVCSSDLLTNRHRTRHLRGMTPPSSPPLQPDPHGFKRRGVLFVLASPSGAGKSPIARQLPDAHPDLGVSISATPRPVRTGALDGKAYPFRHLEPFRTKPPQGEFPEWAH